MVMATRISKPQGRGLPCVASLTANFIKGSRLRKSELLDRVCNELADNDQLQVPLVDSCMFGAV